MATLNFTWTISAVDVLPSANGLSNVIKTIHWRYKGVTADGNNSAETYGAQVFPAPNAENFTAYDSLTKDQIITWLESSMNITKINETLSKRVDAQLTPTIVQDTTKFQ